MVEEWDQIIGEMKIFIHWIKLNHLTRFLTKHLQICTNLLSVEDPLGSGYIECSQAALREALMPVPPKMCSLTWEVRLRTVYENMMIL